jgi:hypothetical protein
LVVQEEELDFQIQRAAKVDKVVPRFVVVNFGLALACIVELEELFDSDFVESVELMELMSAAATTGRVHTDYCYFVMASWVESELRLYFQP